MSKPFRLALAPFAVVALAACADEPAPLAPDTDPRTQVAAKPASLPAVATENQVIATLRRATARYHDLEAAKSDGFVFLHECENRPGEGPVGMVYIHVDRLMDGVIDPSLPDGLVYEPSANGPAKLVAAEFAVPYVLWNSPEPPTFMGAEFQSEPEFGVWGLHVWIWRHNPEGLFGESNPNISCEAA